MTLDLNRNLESFYDFFTLILFFLFRNMTSMELTLESMDVTESSMNGNHPDAAGNGPGGGGGPPEPPAAPIVDEDGFTLVRTKKKK